MPAERIGVEELTAWVHFDENLKFRPRPRSHRLLSVHAYRLLGRLRFSIMMKRHPYPARHVRTCFPSGHGGGQIILSQGLVCQHRPCRRHLSASTLFAAFPSVVGHIWLRKSLQGGTPLKHESLEKCPRTAKNQTSDEQVGIA